ncbi:glycoside hydrolase family 2 protein [Gimesia fumaroli]|uniref:Beta-galactosidase n=1 Tax=Gimesia fumaroli TaxID=2527976 RepID=A0A518IFW3_9PLAN|nr:sugar-binding domain-containing protein [Gimesia fumaroli]QDV51968.1 Beta-galactosidase [Gimesia fumaroli]
MYPIRITDLVSASDPVRIASALAVMIFSSTLVLAQEINDQWRYTFQRPADGWQSTQFDDSKWQTGPGGFGTRNTPGSRVGTNWKSENIWLRKTFQLKDIPQKPALMVHHDDEAEIYINGQRVADLKGWTTNYSVIPLDETGIQALQKGKNLLAVHCFQDGGGQFIDVHVVDIKHVPQLPHPQRSTIPFKSKLITKWGEKVTPENAWTEYPRPQLVRDNWKNLNGHWDYAITAIDQKKIPQDWTGKILVPFCLESKLGGVQRLLTPSEALWYRRTFAAPQSTNRRMLLNFEAVDYFCDVFVNRKFVGSHKGGNTPFSFDVTEQIRPGQNSVIVRVKDATEGWQLRGKQTLDPRGIWYTQVSGIWQTVWLEQVGPSYIEDLKIQTDAMTGIIRVYPEINNGKSNQTVEIIVKDGDQKVAEAKGTDDEFSITIPDAKLWSPDSPQLYNLEISLIENGNIIDQIKSYTGIRSVSKIRDKDGHLRFTLNGKTIFHWGPLDQGWWPDGLLTPPSDEALLFDIEYLKAAGFNMIRKHIKVEPRRFYYHCDRLGMMVWQDQVSAGHNPPWTRLKHNPVDAPWSDQHHDQYMHELEQMIDTLENHPCIVVWVPFNEAWGQHRTLAVGKWAVKRDPSRLINIASGGNFWPVGDVVDAHQYPHPGFPFEPGRYDNYIKVIGEFGGHGYPVKDHLWDSTRRNWGYGDLPQNEAEYKARYQKSLHLLNDLRKRGIAAGVYTQTTDVEGEINGLMTYDRRVIKIPAKDLAKLHELLLSDQP